MLAIHIQLLARDHLHSPDSLRGGHAVRLGLPVEHGILQSSHPQGDGAGCDPAQVALAPAVLVTHFVGGMIYESSQMKLGEGDTLFLYTDGVTEALDPDEQLFGEDRLRDALNNERGRELRVSELLPYVRSALEDFAQGAEQADDITMLGITYRGLEKGGDA